MSVTAIYAGLLGLLYVYLSARVIAVRRGSSIALGDGGDKLLLRRIRVHANFAEYVPMAIVLMALAESMKSSGWLVHGLGVALCAGRVVHAYGVSRPNEVFALRVTGMSLTFGVIVTAALTCLWMALLA